MPRLEYDVVFNLDKSSTRTLRDSLNNVSSGGIENAANDVDDLNISLQRASEGADVFSKDLRRSGSQIEKFRNETNEGAASLRRFGEAQEVVQQGNRNVSKTANNANQILFSFGDAVQDGAQFQHGFGAGARAVGNNLTFASEQISLATAKAGSFGGAMKSLGSALIGPAGIVLAINAAVTVLTVFGDELLSTGKKAKKTKEEIEGVTSIVSDLTSELAGQDFFGDDPFGVSELRFEQDELNRLIQQTEQAKQRLSLTKDQQSELRRLVNLQSQSSLRVSELTTEEENRLNLLKARQQQAESFNELINQLKEDEADVTAELDRQLRIRQRFNELTRQGQLDIGRADTISRPDIIGSGAKQAAQERQEFFNKLGISEVQLEQSIANKKVQIHKDAEEAKSKITQAQAQARERRALTAIEGVGRGITQLFAKQKEVAIAGALVQAGAAIVRQFKDLPLWAAIPSAALVAAKTMRQIQQIRSIEPGSGGGVSSGGGRAGGIRPEGFNVDTIERSGRPSPDPDTAMNQNSGNAPINVELRTEADSRIISKKATQGRKRIDSNTTVKIRSEA